MARPGTCCCYRRHYCVYPQLHIGKAVQPVDRCIDAVYRGCRGNVVIEFSHAVVRPVNPAAFKITTLKMQQISSIAMVWPQATFMDKAGAFFSKNANTIVMIWFLVVCARSLQLATGLNGLYHLRRRSVFPVEGDWEKRTQLLAIKLGIGRVVGIAESGLAKVPMVIGHLKPLILIPIGLMTALSNDEIEAILVHELAHIRRRDYLVNMLQSLMEIVFFFNPAVLWISALIKNERENCCDDIAVAQSSSKVNYIKALVSCQEYRLAAPAYAMALNGNKGHLVSRVKRILTNNNNSLNLTEKTLLAICLVAAGLMTAAFTNAEKINKLVSAAKKAVINKEASTAKKLSPANISLVKPPVPANMPTPNTIVPNVIVPNSTKDIAKADTGLHPVPKIYRPQDFGNGTFMIVNNNPYTSYIEKENDTFYQLNYLSKKLASMQVNGETIPASQIPQYQSQIDALLNKFKSIREPAEPKEPEAPKETSAPSDYLQKDQAISDSVNQAYKKSAIKYHSEAKIAKPAIPASPASPAAPARPAYYPQDVYNPSSPAYKAYATIKDDHRRDNIISEMKKDGIITTTDNLSFKISTGEFIVNGKKQPDDVYKKYRAKYVKATGGHNEWSWMYNYDTDAKRESNTVVDNNK